MKVFNLSCDHEHAFEGWFASHAEFDRQLTQGLVECPVCGSHAIQKLPSAPRLNVSGAVAPESDASGKQPVAMGQDEVLTRMLLEVARHIATHTEDVGERFPEEARRIHYSEVPKRSIRGLASRDEAADLVDEGIEIFPVPLAELLKKPLQ
jgi:hypothetical protein